MLSTYSYTRVTLTLDIIRRLMGGIYAGYHEVNIIKHQIDLYDIISVEESENMQLRCDHPEVPTDSRNICWKAALLLKSQFGIKQNVSISIKKNIPPMGGLAGGSANAATTLKLLNELWGLSLNLEQQIKFARQLGMDVPYYFLGYTALDTEATEQLQPIQTSMEFVFVLAIAGFGVSTCDAYRNIDYSLIGQNAIKTKRVNKALIANNRKMVIENLHNDFEFSVFKSYPRLKAIKEEMLAAGCEAALLSGSGSTIIGIAPSEEEAFNISSKLSCRSIVAKTLR